LVMAYAGTAWPMAAYRLIVDGGVLVIWLVAVFGFGTWLSRLFLIKAESGESLLMFVSQTALGLGAISLVVLGLGLAGVLNQGVAIALVGVGVVLGLVRVIREKAAANRIRGWFAESAGWEWLGLLAVPFAAVMTVG